MPLAALGMLLLVVVIGYFLFVSPSTSGGDVSASAAGALGGFSPAGILDQIIGSPDALSVWIPVGLATLGAVMFWRKFPILRYVLIGAASVWFAIKMGANIL